MEYRDIVDVLDIALLEVSVHTKFLSQKVKCIEGFGLRLSDRRDLGVSWELPEAYEITSPVLERNPLWRALSCRMVEQQRSLCVLLLGVLLKPEYARVSMDGLVPARLEALTPPYPKAG